MTDDEATARANLLLASQAMTEILRKHDIVAVMALAGQYGRSEAVSHLQASWLKAKVFDTPEGTGVRLTSKLADYGGDEEAKTRDVASTMSALASVAEILARNGLMLMSLVGALNKELGAESGPLVLDDPTTQ